MNSPGAVLITAIVTQSKQPTELGALCFITQLRDCRGEVAMKNGSTGNIKRKETPNEL